MSALTISTRVVAVDPVKPDESVMRAAGARVQKGGLVAFPTESFYGLGADALDPAAVARVFEVKGRSGDKPLLV
ncbi:MAG TPA: Sua5/YciO/YrdC/YwlC family protein, partial [Methylomirabilota bacterium]